MYKKIEELYKICPYYRIKFKMFIAYVLIVFILLILNFFNLDFFMYILVFLTLFIIKDICQKELKMKLYLCFWNKNKQGHPLDEIVFSKDKKLFIKYLKANKLYNPITLKCFLEHYRNLIRPKTVSDNFWSIVAIIVSILLAFVSNDGFNLNSFNNSLPYLISLLFFIIIFWLFARNFSRFRSFFNSKEVMYERLEEIFSELFIESEMYEKKMVKKIRNKKCSWS